MKSMQSSTSIALMLVTPMTALALGSGYQDRYEVQRDGVVATVRTALWPTPEGGVIEIEQVLLESGDGDYIYDTSRQPEATRRYHQAHCASRHLKPEEGESIIGGENAIGGFICGGVGPDEAAIDRTIDWAIAYAPSSSQLVNTNFLSFGRLRYLSSIAGMVDYSLVIDGQRCRISNSRYGSANVTDSIDATVNCLVFEPRTLITSMQGCTPKLCTEQKGRVVIHE